MGHKELYDGGLAGALSVSELAARLGVKPQTIYDMRSEGRGPTGFRVGSQLRFRESVIDAWICRLEDEDQQRHIPSSK
jgi:excisionase family DNA binding protein